MAAANEDWRKVAERLAAGDKLAFIQLSRLVVGHLAQLRAYDFRDDWSDVVQEVATAVVIKVREERITDRSTVKALIFQITRNKHMDRLRAHYRRRENETLPWDEATEDFGALPAGPAPDSEAIIDLRWAMGQLDPLQQSAVAAVHGEGLTYDEAVERTGIPLGSLKRHLRDGLTKLRKLLAAKTQTKTQKG